MHALHAAVLCALELDHAAAALFLVTGMERHACFFLLITATSTWEWDLLACGPCISHRIKAVAAGHGAWSSAWHGLHHRAQAGPPPSICFCVLSLQAAHHPRSFTRGDNGMLRPTHTHWPRAVFTFR
jgi:hypothetical protein